jgi:biopolymer transport protein ExbD
MRRFALPFALLTVATLAGCHGETPACAPLEPTSRAAPSASVAGSALPGPAIDLSQGGDASAVLAIRVARDGALSIEGARVEDPIQLTARTRTSLQARPDLRIVISAEKDVPFERVIRAVDLVSAAGATRISFAVAPPAASGAAGGPAEPPTAVPTPSLYSDEPWRCARPTHAPHGDASSGAEAGVFVRIHVDAAGNPTNVDVIDDPGRGLGEAARACAMARTYRPAVDAKGRPVPGALKLQIKFAP